MALTQALQASRERLVSTREEERRRLRRDLHDGLGPTLAGIALGIDTVRRALPDTSPPGTADLLVSLREEAERTVADIRRIAYNLRPPVLDERGLADAIREHATRLGGATVVIPTPLPPLSAAVEVAAYRIAVEAMTNASRHAPGAAVEVSLSVNGCLELQIADAGAGLPGLPRRRWPAVHARARRRTGRGVRAQPARPARHRGAGQPAAGSGPVVTGAATVRVVVVDDHPLFRQGIGALIRDSPETELAGDAASGEEAVARCAQLEPDVVVMDVHMPGLGGVEATRQILRARPQTAIVMLTMMDEDDSVFAAMRAGARGYVLKGAQPAEILRAVLAAASGQAIFGRDVAQRISRLLRRRWPGRGGPAVRPPHRAGTGDPGADDGRAGNGAPGPDRENHQEQRLQHLRQAGRFRPGGRGGSCPGTPASVRAPNRD